MFLQRIFTDGLAQASFVIGSDQTRQAVVIDPRRDVDVYLDIANAHQLTISHVFETHIHADFASGARELAKRAGAQILLSAVGESQFRHTPVRDGDEITVGELRLRVLLTPGHTPEHISILVTDSSAPDAPPLLFSGDMLFAGAVGRPDLLGESQTRSLARALYRTIHQTLMPLDDDIVVYPGHGAGSACGKAIGDAESTTLGQEKRFNYAFQPMDEETFIRVILEDLPEPPPYFPVMKKLNKRGPEILGGILRPRRLDLDDLRAIQAGEWGRLTLLDVREAEEFGLGFLRGSLNIGLGPNLPNWAGWTISYDHPIALIVGDELDVEPAVTQLIRIGLDAVCGYAVADLAEWEDYGLAIQHIEQLDVDEARAQLERGRLLILDVRDLSEWEQAHIADSRHLPLTRIARGQTDGFDPRRPVATMCAGGYRSSLASSLLRQRGIEHVRNIEGGLDAWEAAGLPTLPSSMGREK